jgi:hypothetical protein
LFPQKAAHIGRELRNGILLPAVFCSIAAGAFEVRGARYIAHSIAFIVALFFLPLWWLWYSGNSETMLIGGLLPYSDASGYLTDARLLSDGLSFNALGNDHPLATALLAVLWNITSGNYHLVLALINLLDATASWLAMGEVTVLLGAIPGATWLLIDFLFVRRFIGMPLSEHLGIIFGSLGITLGCRAARSGQESTWVLSIFALTLALLARSGAILTIPSLLVGAYLAWPKKGHRRWALPTIATLAVIAAFSLNELIKWTVGVQPANTVNDAVYVLYSLVFGGTWHDALNRYGFDSLAVWRVVRAQLFSHPFSLFDGAVRSLVAFVRELYLFSFVARRWLNIALHLAFAAGVIAMLSALRRDRRAWWLVSALVGLLVSMPLLPPWDTDGMRIYAATIPLIALTAAVGMNGACMAIGQTTIGMRIQRSGSFLRLFGLSNAGEPKGLHVVQYCTLAATVALSAFLPPFLRLGSKPPNQSLGNAYSQGGTEASVEYLPNAALHIVSNFTPPSITTLRLADFRAGLRAFQDLYPAEAALLDSLPAECVLLPGSQGMSLIAIDASHVPFPNESQAINLRIHFLTEGWMLIAIDDALLARSSELSAHHSRRMGIFSFGIDRYPVIHTNDTVTLSQVVRAVEQSQSIRNRANSNLNMPLILDGLRLNFPLPGEYYLKINHHFPLKVLVLTRNLKKAESGQLIRNFVIENCIAVPNGNLNDAGISSESDVNRWFNSDEPVRMSDKSIVGITELFQRSIDSSSF